MGLNTRIFGLPPEIDHYLGVLSKVYKTQHEQAKLRVIANSKVEVVEGWTHDNWNGGIDGHAIYLTVPESIYLEVVNSRGKIESDIQNDLNKLHNFESEFIAEVKLEMAKEPDSDWRLQSGALESPRRARSGNAAKRIWGESGYRIFLAIIYLTDYASCATLFLSWNRSRL